jgi:hypothetical protein
MAGTISGGSPAGPGGQGRRRARQPVPRTRTVEFTLNAQEYGLLVEAARQAGRQAWPGEPTSPRR